MIPLFSTQQVREVDVFAAEQLGMPTILLMENAAIEIYNIASEKIKEMKISDPLLGFLCGKGNNGGDGFAAARHFANNGYKVLVFQVGAESEMSQDALTNFLILRRLSEDYKKILIKRITSEKDFGIKECDVLFDALLGSGARGELHRLYKSIIQKANKTNAFKIAIDIPTGLNADSGDADELFNADLTITLGELKKGLFLNKEYCGEVVKGNIGINNDYFDRFDISEYLIEPEDVYISLPPKKKSSHKYSAGKVFTIAGSGKLPGAAALTSKAALRIGAGASILGFPKSVRKFVHKNAAEVIIEAYEDNGDEILKTNNLKELNKRIEWADVLAIGPGLGREEETRETILEIIREHRYKSIVIDADAIFALGDDKYKEINLEEAVLTPHHGEFSNLIRLNLSDLKKDLLGCGKKFASEKKCYLILKGAPTIIFNPGGEAFINTSGNPGMAKFGTGDVLTGVLAGLIAQSENQEQAIINGVYLHSLAADLLLNKYTEFGFTASDLINKLPYSIKFIRKTFA